VNPLKYKTAPTTPVAVITVILIPFIFIRHLGFWSKLHDIATSLFSTIRCFLVLWNIVIFPVEYRFAGFPK
jgi:hypothetical protein